MLKSVQFKNFKVLRDATLPLSRFTLIVGPNGSGKSTALQGLQALTHPPQALVTAGIGRNSVTVEITLHWGQPYEGVTTTMFWIPQKEKLQIRHLGHTGSDPYPGAESLHSILSRVRIYSLDAKQLPL